MKLPINVKFMKNILYFTFAIAILVGCKKEPEKFKISGRIMDGTTKNPFKGLTFEVYTKGGPSNKIKDKLGTFTTNDSGDFEFIYEKVKGMSVSSISLLNNFMKFENISLNQNINKEFFKSLMGKYKVKCNCPNIKPFDTLFLEYGKISGTELKRAIDTLTNLKTDDYFIYSTWPQESITLRWGINSKSFSWQYYQGEIVILNYLGKVSGKVSGDPTIDEFEIKF